MICYLAVHYVWIALGASLENLTIEGLDFLNMPVYVICGTGSRVEEVECWRLLHVTPNSSRLCRDSGSIQRRSWLGLVLFVLGE